MADHNYQQIVKNNNQKLLDYANDALEPHNRFCPTDLVLISCFLKPKFKTGKKNSGKGWFYEKLNVYDYNPDDLTEEYESCDNKWYFLTLRERKHLSGKRSHRQTRNLGTWKATGKDTTVCDHVTQRVLGRKRCLVFHDKNKCKTPWLMHEYTFNYPIKPIGSRGQYKHKNEMDDWVLCKIYKKEANIHVADQLQNTRNQDEPSPSRRRLSVNLENNVHVGSSQTLPSTSVNTSTHSETKQPMPMFCGSNVTQTAIKDPSRDNGKQVQASIGNSTCEYYHNKSRPSVTQGFQFSSSASSSSSVVAPCKVDVYTHVALPDDLMTCPAQESTTQLDTMQPMASSQSSKEELLAQDV
ncbi:NAC domain-containing protein [Tanacetum coccineum]